jgi:hypothetical protein
MSLVCYFSPIQCGETSPEFETPVILSINMTYVAFYGERDEIVRVQGALKHKSYDWCYNFATSNVVDENVHFTAAMLPVGDAD